MAVYGLYGCVLMANMNLNEHTRECLICRKCLLNEAMAARACENDKMGQLFIVYLVVCVVVAEFFFGWFFNEL